MKNTRWLSSKRLIRTSLILLVLGTLSLSGGVSAQANGSPNAANGNANATSANGDAKPSKKVHKPKATAKAKGDATAAKDAESPAAEAPKITPRLALPPREAQAQPRDCNLLVKEAPRGGQLEVQGQTFGESPVVRVGNQVTRILRREPDKISVQIPRNSSGGPVTVLVAGKQQQCGSLTIIGLDVD